MTLSVALRKAQARRSMSAALRILRAVAKERLDGMVWPGGIVAVALRLEGVACWVCWARVKGEYCNGVASRLLEEKESWKRIEKQDNLLTPPRAGVK